MPHSAPHSPHSPDTPSSGRPSYSARGVRVWSLLSCAVLLTVMACGLATSEAGAITDAGTAVDGNGQGAAFCPNPDAGAFPDQSPCSAPDGTTCPVGNCGGMLAVCQRGVWRLSTFGPQPPPCPSEVPTFGDPCSACWLQSGGACYYHCGPGEQSLRARCRMLGTLTRTPTWLIEEAPCEGADGGLPGNDASVTDAADPDATVDP